MASCLGKRTVKYVTGKEYKGNAALNKVRLRFKAKYCRNRLF